MQKGRLVEEGREDSHISVAGTFVQQGYPGLVQKDTGSALYDTLRAAFPKGSVITINFSATLTGMMPMCQAETKYSVCGEILKADGSCPSPDTHKVPEVETLSAK